MKKKQPKDEILNAVMREKRKNYIILYAVTLLIWIGLVAFSFLRGYFSGKEFIINIVNNLIGIIPPILIFDFFNEKLSRDSSAIEMSNKITETLMSNPETLELFKKEQKENFLRSTIASVAKDDDVVEMINDNIHNYLFTNSDYRIRTQFSYDFELDETLPTVFDGLFADSRCYFYVQEKLHYRVKYLSEKANNTNTGHIKLGFVFNNNHLDSALREKNTDDFFQGCIFRESLDIRSEDIDGFKAAIAPKERFQQLFKVDLKVDHFGGVLEDVRVSNAGIVCVFAVDHDPAAMEHTIRIIFHMPKKWNSPIEVALVDPVRAPKISLSYPEDMMEVEMFSFLSKSEEASLAVAHEQLNGIYDIALSTDWVYPISGMIFTVSPK